MNQNEFTRTISLASFTPRERQVLRLVAMGLSNKEVSTYLGLRVKTIDFYRQNVMRKLAVRNVVHLTHCAIRLGLIKFSQLGP